MLLDTTVLVKSLLGPGINRDLLKMARTPVFFEPVLSNVCLLEFIRNAAKGLKTSSKLRRDPYEWHELKLFLENYIYPVVGEEGPVNSAFGRENKEVIERFTRTATLRDVLTELTSLTDRDAKGMVQQQELNEPLERYDMQDFHVWATAIEANCDYIVTDNTHQFPKWLGSIERVSPEEFMNRIISI